MGEISLKQTIQCCVAEQTKTYLKEKIFNTPFVKIEIEGIELSKQKEFLSQTLKELSEKIINAI